MKTATQLVRFDAAPGDPHAPTSTPIYQTATFGQPSAMGDGSYDYSRSGNPTRTVLEDHLAALEGADSAFVFTSGMAALSVVTRLLRSGERILAGADLYGGAWRLLTRLTALQGVEVCFVDTTDLNALEVELQNGAVLLLLETPTNPLLDITDLRAVSALCKQYGTRVAVDASLMTPLLQRPLELGADLVVHSATKALGGHSDLTAGVIATNDKQIAEHISFVQNAEGNALDPFQSWLLLRGMKTMQLRVRQQEKNTQRLVRALEDHPAITKLLWPGRKSHPSHRVHCSQASGFGPVFSFCTGSVELSQRIVDQVKHFNIAVSFGGVASHISLPCRMSHASIPDGVRTLPEDLVRVSVGIEDSQDLIEDLLQALDQAVTAQIAIEAVAR
jgi:cystathionine beta-lyase